MEKEKGFELLILNETEALSFARTKGDRYLTKLQGGVTLIDEEGRATIVIDRSLNQQLREVYLAHEAEQLRVIMEMRERGIPFTSSCYVAHQVGLNAGVEKASELGVLDEYLKHRGVGSLAELR